MKKILWKPNQGPQTDALKVSPNDYFEIGFGGRRGGGKGQPLDANILTPFGWKKMGELKIGSLISNPDGSVSNIIGIYPLGEQDIFKISFNDGTWCEVTEDHLWLAWRSNAQRKKNGKIQSGKDSARIWTTKEIKEKVGKKKRFLVPITSPVCFTTMARGNPRPLSSYLLGVLLGDGCLTLDRISFCGKDKEIADKIRKQGYALSEYRDKRSGVFHWKIKKENNVAKFLKRWGLLPSDCFTKFIPSNYLLGSVEERIELLRGLMDTDGWCDKDGAAYYCTTSEWLKNDVVALVRSLGAVVFERSKIPTFRGTNGEKKRGVRAWTLYIKTKNASDLFFLDRKKKLGKSPQSLNKVILSVSFSRRALAQCIKVSNPNSLYITDGFTITHNTAGGIGWLLYDKDHPLLRALVIRRNSDDLKDWIDRANRIYQPLGAKLVGTPPYFQWPSGAIFRTGHLKDANAYSKYVGHEYQRMLVEELNLIPTEENYLKLISSCRSTIPELPPQVMTNFNPSDVGFDWIKKRFNLSGIPEKSIETIDEKTGLKRIFIPSGLKDNPYLDKDPQYNAFLNGLPDGLREAWRDGSWEEPQITGGMYTLELAQARNEGRIKLVPFDVNLRVHTVWDLGMDDAMSIGFFQRTSIDFRLINYYQNEGFGLDHYQAKLGEFRDLYKYNYKSHYAPFDVNKRELSTGQTLRSSAEKIGLRFEVVPSIGLQDGINGVRLMFPRLYINEILCGQFLTAIKNYRKQWNEKLLKFSDEPIHDWTSHAADMLRYAALIEHRMTNDDNDYVSRYYGQLQKITNPGR